MKIMRNKPNRVWCTIEYIIQHHENHKHESLCLTPSLFLDITCNLRHKLKLDLWDMKSFTKKITCKERKKKMACVKPYEKM
jgi:hypothetical protein